MRDPHPAAEIFLAEQRAREADEDENRRKLSAALRGSIAGPLRGVMWPPPLWKLGAELDAHFALASPAEVELIAARAVAALKPARLAAFAAWVAQEARR